MRVCACVLVRVRACVMYRERERTRESCIDIHIDR